MPQSLELTCWWFAGTALTVLVCVDPDNPHTSDIQLTENPWSWSKAATVIYGVCCMAAAC